MRAPGFTAAIAVALSSAAFAASTPAVTGLQAPAAGLPRIGTRYIPDDRAASDTVPVDKRWDQLLPSQQALFKRSWYEDMPDADEPPYPVNGPSEILADIIKIKNALPVTGVLFATVLVDETGKGVQVTFHQIPDEKLRQVLGYALLKPQFKPARCSGKPCVMEYPVMASFEPGAARPAPAQAPAPAPAAVKP